MTDDELKRLIEGSAAETRRHVEETASETRRHVEAVAVETRRHFDVAVEDFKSQVQLVAENVLMTGERLDRRIDDLESRMTAEFGELRAGLRFSYSDLDRRLRSLEERVERLESRPTN
jgi:hypothetical protein